MLLARVVVILDRTYVRTYMRIRGASPRYSVPQRPGLPGVADALVVTDFGHCSPFIPGNCCNCTLLLRVGICYK